MVVTLAFADAPLEGFLHLRPQEETVNWSHGVDVDDDGTIDHEGILNREIGFAYRFVTPGVHHLHVSLSGPQGTETLDFPVVVNDPEAIRVLAQNRSGEADPEGSGPFEGITTNHAGTALFVGDFGESELYRLDPADLRTLAPPLALSRSGRAEGLAVPPSDTLLFVAHKRYWLSVVAIPSMELRRSLPMPAEFFIHAMNDTTAISTGSSGVVLVDTRSGSATRSFRLPGAWHFAASPLRDLLVVISNVAPRALYVLTLPDLQEVNRILLPDLFWAQVVAFDPSGDRIYVMGRDDAGSRFLLIDPVTRRVLRSMPLGPGPCSVYCVANPSATLPSGRLVAMEQGGGVYFIDTELDLPRFYTGIRSSHFGMSVAASPVDDVFFLLGADGLVSRIQIRD